MDMKVLTRHAIPNGCIARSCWGAWPPERRLRRRGGKFARPFGSISTACVKTACRSPNRPAFASTWTRWRPEPHGEQQAGLARRISPVGLGPGCKRNCRGRPHRGTSTPRQSSGAACGPPLHLVHIATRRWRQLVNGCFGPKASGCFTQLVTVTSLPSTNS